MIEIDDKTSIRSSKLTEKYVLQPPEPLFYFEEQKEDVELQLNTIHSDPFINITHIENLIPAGQGGSIQDPILSKKLSKWFVSRAGKEVMVRQSESYNSSSCVLLEESSVVEAEDVFSEFTVFDSKNTEPNSNSDDSGDERLPSETTSGKKIGMQKSLKFDSNFESGNLSKAVRVCGRSKFMTQRALDLLKDCAIPCAVDQEYDLVLQNDTNTAGNIQWYYFRATIRIEDSEKFPVSVRFNIVNMQKSDALYNYGMKPIIYSDSNAQNHGVSWIHGGYDICYYKNGRTELRKSENQKKKRKLVQKYSLSFSYTFEGPDSVYFAHSYPYTYTNLQMYLNKLSSRQSIKPFFRRRQLCKTLCGNRCDLITITGPAEDFLESKNRKAIVISARIHPGETNSSFMMHGIIDFLLSDNSEAEILRKLFVFKLIPMLNPDGVIHGNYRCSLAGTDLNRRYNDAHRVLHPEITALKELLKETNERRGVLMYLDLHGHSRNKNVFLYGCDYFLQSEKMAMHTAPLERFPSKIFPRIFPKLLSTISNPLNGGYFVFQDCSFKIQRSKAGTGRVVSWGYLGIECSYTIEISFCGNGNNAEAKILKKAFASEKNLNRSLVLDSSLSVLRDDNTSDAHTDAYATDECFGDDEKESECIAEKQPSESNPELPALLESYKTAKHYTQLDFMTMGKDLCIALMHFVNVRSLSQLKVCNDLIALNASEVPEPTERKDDESENVEEPRIRVLDEYNPNAPLINASVFSPEAIRFAVNLTSMLMGRSSPVMVGGSQIENSSNPPYGYRIHCEIALRKMLGFENALLNDIDGIHLIEEAYNEPENDAGSDSDPSGDNLPLKTVLKEGNLGINWV